MSKKLYQKRKAEHRCTNCGGQDERTLAGLSICKKCPKIKSKYYNKYYSTHKEDIRFTAREYQNKRYHKMLREHRCVQCGKPLPGNYFYVDCEKCKERHKEYRNKRFERIKNERKEN